MTRREFSLERSANQGFSLIEILVTISLMAVMIGVTATGYRNYNRRQTATAAAQRFRQVLQEANANATAGKIDCSVCGGANGKCDGSNDDLPLVGWRVSILGIADMGGGWVVGAYSLRGACGAVDSPTTFPGRGENFSPNVWVNPSVSTVTFMSGGAGTNLGASMTVNFRWKTEASTLQTVTVLTNGLVQ